MTIDEYGVLRFWDGGESDAGPGEGGDSSADAAADAAAASDALGGMDVGGGFGNDAAAAANAPAEPSTIAGYGGLGQVSVNPNPVADEASNITAADLAALQEAGLGSLQGLNPNNPTQSIDELAASFSVHGFANVAVPMLMGFVAPGFSTAMTAAQTLGGLASGQTSIGQTVANAAIGIAANQLGIPPGMVTNAINGNVGGIAGQAAVSAVNNAIASLTGLPVGVVGLGTNMSGMGQGLASNVSGQVNQGLGVTPTNNVAAIGQQIDAALGLTPGQGLGGPASGQSSTPGFDASGEYAPDVSGTGQQTSGLNLSSVLPMLALAGLEEEEEPEPYKGAEITTRSPFGSII